MQNSNIDKISVPSFQFTSDVDTNLHKIFKLIHKSKLYFERFIIKEQTFQLRSVSNIHPEKFISNYSSYPSFIQDHLETIEKNLITFSFTIKQHTFYINIINKKINNLIWTIILNLFTAGYMYVLIFHLIKPAPRFYIFTSFHLNLKNYFQRHVRLLLMLKIVILLLLHLVNLKLLFTFIEKKNGLKYLFMKLFTLWVLIFQK